MDDGFSTKYLEYLTKEVDKMAKKYPKKAKKFLQKSSTGYRKLAKSIAKERVKKGKRPKKPNKKGKIVEYHKRFKKTKVWVRDKEQSVRVYNSTPHAHLLDLGHIIKDKNGKEHGFKKGAFVMDETRKGYEKDFYDGADKFLDEILAEGGF